MEKEKIYDDAFELSSGETTILGLFVVLAVVMSFTLILFGSAIINKKAEVKQKTIIQNKISLNLTE